MKKKMGAIMVGIGLVIAVGLIAMSVKVIEQGHAGVVYNRSTGVEKETLGQGWHLVSPFKRVTEYPVSTETVRVKNFNVQTKDGKPLAVSLSYLEAPKPDENTAKAIQGVVDAQQQLEKLEIEKKQAIVATERDIEEAKGKAQASEILKQSLSPEIVEIKKIERWDGKLPQVSGGATPFVQIK